MDPQETDGFRGGLLLLLTYRQGLASTYRQLLHFMECDEDLTFWCHLLSIFFTVQLLGGRASLGTQGLKCVTEVAAHQFFTSLRPSSSETVGERSESVRVRSRRTDVEGLTSSEESP